MQEYLSLDGADCWVFFVALMDFFLLDLRPVENSLEPNVIFPWIVGSLLGTIIKMAISF